jgi:Ca2+-binding RTX toxin-like protein
LTTPGGEHVQYTSAERILLARLNVPVPALPITAALLNSALNGSLDNDIGITRADNQPGSVLQPNERLVVTGHSIGGHLALLFGRLFPQATEQIYTFNAPGIAAWANLTLGPAGVAASDPSRVLNILSAYGTDFVAAFGTRPGQTIRVFNEAGNSLQNHSIVAVTDSLALYELFGALSPGLANRIDEVSSILAAASAKPAESLEATLDMLRHRLMGDVTPTRIAAAASDQEQRNDYYTRLYEVRDTFAGGRDWGIASLAGLSAATLQARAVGNMAVRQALADLTPFAMSGATPDASLATLSNAWLEARADFLSHLLESRTADRAYGLSGNPRSLLFVDVGQNERLSVLSPSASGTAQSLAGSDAALDGYLSGLSYGAETVFGSDDAAHPDTVDGTAGGDRFFGNGGNDTLRGLAGPDVLEGGAGADRLEGGADHDLYFADAPDTIYDSDGQGEIHLGNDILDGGTRRSSGQFAGSNNGHAHVYEFSGDLASRGTLIVDGTLTVEQFANGDLGIELVDMPGAPGASDFVYYGDRHFASLDQYGNVIGDTALPDIPDFFGGRPGNTSFITAAGNDQVAESLGGDDTLLLGAGDDLGFGGRGNDRIEGGSGRDILLGGRGDDVIFAESPGDDIDSTPTSAPASIFQRHILSGGEGADTIVGSAEADFIEGGAGADEVIAGAGNDVIYADGTYASYLLGETYDRRTVSYSSGTFSEDGWSVASDALGSGLYHGPPGVYTLSPDAPSIGAQPYLDSDSGGDDLIHAGAGNDYVFAGRGADRAFGGSGIDRIYGAGGNDELHGEDGSDFLYGEEGDDKLIGGADADSLYGGAGRDLLDGGPAGDALFVASGDTILMRRGSGLDVATADGAFPASATVRFEDDIIPADVAVVDFGSSWRLVTAQSDGVTFNGAFSNWTGIGVEFSDGTQWNHDAIAGRRQDLLTYLAGTSEATFATVGPDQLRGGPASDRLAGGAGNDTYIIAANGGRDSIEDYQGSNVLRIDGVLPTDASVYTSGDDYLVRYPGGEARLVGEAQAGAGVDLVFFSGDRTIWRRSDLAARATQLPDRQSLGVQAASAGQAFSFAVPEAAFGEQHTLGSVSYDASTVEGGTLPAWLHFDREHGVLSGTPAAADAGVTSVLIAQRDAGEVTAVSPLVITVAAPADTTPPSVQAATPPVQTGAAPAAGTAAPSSQTTVVPADPAPAPAAQPAAQPGPQVTDVPVPESRPESRPTAAASDGTAQALPASREEAQRSFAPAAQVGKIEDAVYQKIGDLLFAPATLHATGFMDRYTEAVREFRERQSAPEQAVPPAPPPTDEEIGAYNAALHAWLDNDVRRFAGTEHGDARDHGGMEIRHFAAGGGIERLLGVADQAFARPGLPALKTLQPQPGLRDGMSDLSG